MSAPRPARLAAPAVLADGRGLSGGMLRQLFIGQCMVLALHLAWMPAWLVALALAVAGYRLVQLRRRLPRAGILLRLAAVGGLVLALWLQFGTLGTMDGLVGLLLGVYLLKLLETHDRRDARVVVVIGLVTTAVAFLHDQGIPMAAGALLAVAWLLQSLVWLSGATGLRQAWRETAWLLALSAPLMAVLFVAFPRLGPLWSMPQMDRASTGLTDEISPGDIAELSRSDARAFRARFEGREPAPDERYWRVYTLSHFDGIRWSRATPDQLAVALERPGDAFVREGSRSPWQAQDGARFSAELLLEPDSRPWRPSLGTPLESDSRQRYLADGTLEGLTPLSSRSLLRLSSSGAPPVNPDPAGERWHRLLPDDTNPRTRTLAERLWRESGGDPDAYLEAMMARFGEAPYRYTLSPPRLVGEHRVDDFLFDSQAGYCTYYASAAAVMARMAGIPARVVAGFLGGERHPDGHFTIRDYDAHAWVEVWREGAWRRLDPTAVIAPERIEQGPQAVDGGAETFLADARFSPLRMREVGWVNHLRLEWERLEYRWQRGVIGYQRESRRSLMAQLVGWWREVWARLDALLPGRGAMTTALGLMAMLVVAAGLVLLARRGWQHHRRQRDERWLVGSLQAWLARHGLAAHAGESPAAHLRRIAPQAGPAGRALEECARDLERLAYAPLEEAERRQRRRRLSHRVAEVRRRLPRQRRGPSGAGA
ncbi:transglutaminaseTgpA domain-containing protein [Halomonas rhizosphaerae]|uniref:TransglutaminaseTgpA domain-containing protein n=1 Tax=Halomonas rhizosphaerae TaxID=3043296 RepID=A0ABT6V2Q3_9GAMM|nr:transglutaminaseTgpA domain-containing protein [Halomonas rhizosphaerae]MDI5892513.1 transglutaminaseTgpA domain-containing protein [Halomonas rhizosphaerae]MDI5922369.1 transglutaminaseTgpA domain-containing protein [Halomonas rhizosphaerae]